MKKGLIKDSAILAIAVMVLAGVLTIGPKVNASPTAKDAIADGFCKACAKAHQE
jgi:hypothetical protein